jgi:hypothetical protein
MDYRIKLPNNYRISKSTEFTISPPNSSIVLFDLKKYAIYGNYVVGYSTSGYFILNTEARNIRTPWELAEASTDYFLKTKKVIVENDFVLKDFPNNLTKNDWEKLLGKYNIKGFVFLKTPERLDQFRSIRTLLSLLFILISVYSVLYIERKLYSFLIIPSLIILYGCSYYFGKTDYLVFLVMFFSLHFFLKILEQRRLSRRQSV